MKIDTPYNAKIAARYMVALANSSGILLNATQLQKLLFIAYGYVLANGGDHLLKETPKAWPFGPVFPSVQQRVKLDKIIELNDPAFDDLKKNEEVTQLFKDVVKKYSNYSASQLSNWSHKEDSPWDRTVKLPGFKWNDYIPDEFIADYFSKFNVR